VRSPHPSPLPEGEGAPCAPFRAFLGALGQPVIFSLLICRLIIRSKNFKNHYPKDTHQADSQWVVAQGVDNQGD
jgi:hypothetical protein